MGCCGHILAAVVGIVGDNQAGGIQVVGDTRVVGGIQAVGSPVGGEGTVGMVRPEEGSLAVGDSLVVGDNHNPEESEEGRIVEESTSEIYVSMGFLYR